MYIKNAKLVLETGIIWDGVLKIEGDRIVAYGDKTEIEIPEDAEVLDAKGLYVGPGFVDIHVHGGGGAVFTKDTEAAVRHFLNFGETTILPTLYYDLSREGFIQAIEKIRDVKESSEKVLI